MQGSVRQRKKKDGKPGLWEYRFDVGVINGKRKQISKGGFVSKPEAEKALREAISLYEKGFYQDVSKDMTLTELIKLNLKDKSDEGIIRESTLEMHLSYLNYYIEPHIGHYKVTKLNKGILKDFLLELRKSYSRGTVLVVKGIVSSALKKARELNIIVGNPLEGIEIPKDKIKVSLNDPDAEDLMEKDKVKVLTPEQTLKIFDYVKNRVKKSVYGHGMYAAILIGYYTGMRIGEVLALKWKNVDLENKTINVCWNYVHSRKKKEDYLGPVKTQSSNRFISMGDALCTELKRIKLLQKQFKWEYKDFFQDSDFVCTRNNGKNITLIELRQYCCKTISNKTKIPFNFHMLRHPYVKYTPKNNLGFFRKRQCGEEESGYFNPYNLSIAFLVINHTLPLFR